MAGRPGPSGSTGLLVGMCVAIGFAFLCGVFLVVLWTHQEELRSGKEKAENDARRLLQSAEATGALKAWFDQATTQKSLARSMHEEVTSLGQLVSSDGTSATPGIAKQMREGLDAFWKTVTDEKLVEDPAALQGQSLMEGLRSMYGLYKIEQQANVQNRTSIEELNKQVAGFTQANDELQKSFDATAEELRAKIDQITDEWNEFRSEKEKQFAQVETSNQKAADERIKQEQEFRSQIGGLNKDLDKKIAANEELQKKIREFQILPKPGAAARQADGHVILAKAGEAVVFVDLGAGDHLILGMRFAVYAPDSGIPSSGIAKGVIEVVSIGQDVTECRIKEADELFPIIEGDLIANPIYDRSRQLSFMVIGAFDLDHDGRDDPNGKGTIEAVIRDAGGMIVEELSSRLDFLIVGARPLVGRPGKDPSPEQKAVQADQVREAEAYNAILSEARSLSIPMLAQESFLNFLGRRE